MNEMERPTTYQRSYNSKKHHPLLVESGHWEAFKAKCDELSAADPKLTKKQVYNLAWADFEPLTALCESARQLGEKQAELNKERRATKARKAATKVLDERSKVRANREECIAWVHRAKAIMLMGGEVDYQSAPHWEAVSMLDDAQRDSNWLKKLTQADGGQSPGGEEATDDGGNPSILNSFLAAHSAKPRKERGVSEGSARPGDAAGGSGEAIAG